MRKLSKRSLRNSAIGLGLFVVMLFVLSQEVSGAGTLEDVSKLIEWTGMVFLPLFGLNLDLYEDRTAKIAGIGMLLVHAILLTLLYKQLHSLNYISITSIAVIEMFILVMPFLRIRKRIASRS